VIQSVEDLGVTAAIGNAILRAGGHLALPAILIVAVGSALGANLVNNVPMTLVMVSVLQRIGADVEAHHRLIYASLVGVDLGPNLTTVGSLATMVWMLILRRKGVEVTSIGYFKLGIKVVPVILVVAGVLLWVGL